MLQQAKDDLIARITADEAIKEEAACLVADDLAHSRHLRNVILAASEKMTATSLEEAALVMRTAAAYSTAIKNTSDLIRRSLRLKDLTDDMDELPELVITELSHDEIAELRRQSMAENVEDDAKEGNVYEDVHYRKSAVMAEYWRCVYRVKS